MIRFIKTVLNEKIIILLTILFTNSLFSMDTILLSKDNGEIPLGKYLEILEDKTGELTLDDIQNSEIKRNWFKSKPNIPNFGYTKSIYWVRFQMQPDFRSDYILECGFTPMDKIDFYTTKNSVLLAHKQSGDHFPFKKRNIMYRNPNFLLAANDISVANIYYMRFEASDAMQLQLSIWSMVAFTEKVSTEMYIIGIFFGVLLVMALYNFFLWLSIKDISYFYYVMYLVSVHYWAATYIGMNYQYFWTGSVSIYHFLYASFSFIFPIFMISFSMSFLQTKKYLRKMHKLLSGLRYFLLSGLFITLVVEHQVAIVIAAVGSVLSFPLMFLAGILVLRKGHRPARFYLLAWTFFLVGSSIFLLKTSSILPSNLFTEYAAFLGSAIEVILLSLGLANRINELKREKEKAQLEALASQNLAIENLEKANRLEKDYAENLEKKVIERTFQLNEKMEEVQALKTQQDADYFLTTLLIEPLMVNSSKSKNFKISFFIEQKKKFNFFNTTYQLGGDMCISGDLNFIGEKYVFFFNGDAMGKSMQGAGGALVIGSVMNSILARSAAKGKIITTLNPEQWLQETFEEIQRVMEAFNGSMLVSCTLGLIKESDGEMIYFNADHPFSILLRDGKAVFLEEKINVSKIGSLFLTEFSLNKFQLKKNDVVMIGSDGKDEININNTMNADYTIILEIIEKSESDLQNIYKLLLEKGEIRDDISFVKIEYLH